MRRFGDWLATTGELQTEFGVDFEALRVNKIDLADYITWNFAALFEELGEMMHELRWHPWKINRGVIVPAARERAIEEAVDALHFLANILNALDVSDLEFSDVYAAKQNTNRARLQSGRSLATPGGLGRDTVDRAPEPRLTTEREFVREAATRMLETPEPGPHEHRWIRVSLATSQPVFRCSVAGCSETYRDEAAY